PLNHREKQSAKIVFENPLLIKESISDVCLDRPSLCTREETDNEVEDRTVIGRR
ncbi:hypothetical protein BYT27DRAFT_7095014, partial [Phlegmacium glaucopus]